MDAAFIPTISALAGTVIGGITSFATSWLSQTAQSRAQRLAQERTKREELYSKFLEETARLYSHALTEAQVDYTKLVDIFALRGRILLTASDGVVQGADLVIRTLVDLYIAPNRSDADVRASLEDEKQDVMAAFARACCLELRALRI